MGGAASGRLKIFDETNCLLEGLSETSFTTTVHHQYAVPTVDSRARQSVCCYSRLSPTIRASIEARLIDEAHHRTAVCVQLRPDPVIPPCTP